MKLGVVCLFTLLASALLSFSSHAQSLLNPDRANAVTSLVGNRFDPWENPAIGSHAPSSPGDPDLGEQKILTSLEDYKPFNFQLNQRNIWTDNAALTDGAEVSDFYSNSELRVSLLPQIAANTYGEISAGYSFYRYADHSSLDFDSFEASLGAIHVFRDLNDLSVWLRYNHTRLLTARGHDELFTDHAVEFGLYYPIPLGLHHSGYAAYSSEFSLDGNPSFASRHEHRLTLGYRYAVTDRVELSTFYRLSVHDYTENGRDDLLQTAGVAVTTRVTDRLDLVLSGSYSINDSDLPGGDYEAGDLGAILSLKFEF